MRSCKTTVRWFGILSGVFALGMTSSALAQTATPTATRTNTPSLTWTPSPSPTPRFGQATTERIAGPMPTPVGGPTPVNADAEDAYVSRNGRFVVFTSKATNLLPTQLPTPNGTHSQVYILDRQAGRIELVSRDDAPGGAGFNDGVYGEADSSEPAITNDGRYVVFTSRAQNLVVAGAANTPTPTSTGTITNTPTPTPTATGTITATPTTIARQVVLRDRKAKKTFLISGNPAAPTPGNGDSSKPHIAGDGSYVVFQSAATNINNKGGADTNERVDVYIRNRSVTSPALGKLRYGSDAFQSFIIEGDEHSDQPTISDDGSVLAFSSESNLLELNETNETINPGRDIFFVSNPGDWLTDDNSVPPISRLKRVTTAVDRLNSTNGDSDAPRISGNGRFIVYHSTATNLVNPGASGQQVYLYDKLYQKTVLCSGTYTSTPVPTPGDNSSSNPAVSADGRFVTFQSLAANLGTATSGLEVWGAFVEFNGDGSLKGCKPTLVSKGSGTGADQDAILPSVGTQQRIDQQVTSGSLTPTPFPVRENIVAFHSEATNLITAAKGNTGVSDVFFSPGCVAQDFANDTDNDDTVDCFDQCWLDASKVVDDDSDFDGAANCVDACPADPAKTVPGSCGCGVAETDADGDGAPNCVDLCPSDPNKVVAGACGCGQPEIVGCGVDPTPAPGSTPTGTPVATATPTATPEPVFIPAAPTVTRSGSRLRITIPTQTLTGSLAGARIRAYRVSVVDSRGRVIKTASTSRRSLSLTVSGRRPYTVYYRLVLALAQGGELTTRRSVGRVVS